MASILIIEDEKAVRSSMVSSLQLEGHRASGAACLKDAWELIRSKDFDAVVTDVNLVGESGMDLVKRLREEGWDGAILVITAFGSVDTAVDAMKSGADDYLQKPLSLDALSVHLARALENRRTKSRLNVYERLESVRTSASENMMVGESPAWQRALETARRFAAMPIPRGGEPAELPAVLLLGETGVGKGVVAQYVHRSAPGFDPRHPAPFVHVNCAALPASLIEAELFGHEQGAFTDAKAARSGLFEIAEGGTIFLDEIGEMPLEMQAKLLLVVERGTFRRIGGSRERTARARILAATNVDLESLARVGRFRRDLLYRLNALTVSIPALRQRPGDALLIARRMLDRLSRQQGKPGLTLDASAEAAINAHPWPGNVRELINALKRATMMCEPPNVSSEDLGLVPAVSVPMAALDSQRDDRLRPTESVNGIPLLNGRLPSIDQMESMLITQALRQAHGNVSLAAKLIGLNRGALRYRIERLGLTAKVEEASL